MSDQDLTRPMTREEYVSLMRPVPKRSTTSSGTTETGAGVVTRVGDVQEHYKRSQQGGQDPSTAEYWKREEEKYKAEKQKEIDDERRRQDEARTRNEARAAEIRRTHQRKVNRKCHELNEQFMDGVFAENGLTKDEEATVRQRMCAIGKPNDLGVASILALEVKLSRDSVAR